MSAVIEVKIVSARLVAHGVKVLELAALDDRPLPVTVPGAHIDLRLANGLVRQYSLIEAGADQPRYRIAIAREENGRGGSAYVHDQLREGDRVAISEPRCHFPLIAEAPYSVLIAGGIGITPIWCMARELIAQSAPFELHFAARTRSHAALFDEIEAAAVPKLRTYFNLEGDPLMDLAAIVAAAPEGSHFYCCGPLPLIEAYRLACAEIPAERVHFEQFAATTDIANQGGYTVELARSGLTIEVAAGQTILEALAAQGIGATFSCREGICGACETPVLAGIPDHRDALLTEAERAEGRTMMICCSGALSDTLVLDM